MINKISNGKPLSRGYAGYAGYSYRTRNNYRKCHLCRKTILEGEEFIGFGDDSSKSMHRPCLLDWLAKHPVPKGATTKRLTEEEAEKEFQKIRRKLQRQARSQTQS